MNHHGKAVTVAGNTNEEGQTGRKTSQTRIIDINSRKVKIEDQEENIKIYKKNIGNMFSIDKQTQVTR